MIVLRCFTNISIIRVRRCTLHKLFTVVIFTLTAALVLVAALIQDTQYAIILAVIALVLFAMLVKMEGTHDAPMPHTSYHWLLARIRSWPDEYWQRVGFSKDLFEQWAGFLELAAWRQGNIALEGWRGKESLPDFHYLDKNSGGIGLALLGVLAEMYDAGTNPSPERAERVREMFLNVCPGHGSRRDEPYPKPVKDEVGWGDGDTIINYLVVKYALAKAVKQQAERFKLM